MPTSKCVSIDIDFDDQTFFSVAKLISLRYVKHRCSKSFINELLSSIATSKNLRGLQLSEADVSNIYHAIGEAVINDLCIDLIMERINKEGE